MPEVLLWRELRKRPGGFKFRRQHPAGPFIIDFFCASIKLALEIDGFAHDNAKAAFRDSMRSDFLRSQQISTLRIPAKVVLEEIDVALRRIVEVCVQRDARMPVVLPVPLHHPADGPPPRSGEDL